jgi:hypothetical protein
MPTAERRLVPHLAIVVAACLILIGLIVYPYLPGRHDGLAVALSTTTQMFGVVGLLLVPVGVLWMKFPARRFSLGILSLLVASIVTFVLAVTAAASVGYSFAVLVLAALILLIAGVGRRLRRAPVADDDRLNLLQKLMVWMPLVTLVAQIALAVPMTEWSRQRAMAHADAIIADLEAFRDRHGHYPEALEGLHPDYTTGVVGIERYYYSRQGEAYNLVFEQPRFLLDRVGTREWTVYNPLDQHSAFSHAAGLIEAPETTGPSQGWYAAGEAGRPHWMYFLFD